MNQRPSEEEYAWAIGEYIRLVPDGNIIDILLSQEKQMTELLASLTESHGAYRYAEGKWTLKEVVGHIADGERVMTYRPTACSGSQEGTRRLCPVSTRNCSCLLSDAGQPRSWLKTTGLYGNRRSHCCAGYRRRRGPAKAQPTTQALRRVPSRTALQDTRFITWGLSELGI